MASDFLVKRGTKGLKQFGGRIDEEWMRRLKDTRGERIWLEMSDNDDTIGAILFVIEMLLRNVVWRVEPFSDDPLHEDQALFVESLMTDMEITWEDFIAEALSMLVFGYAPMEICYKRREGPFKKDPNFRSIHSDGLIGWRELAIRSQTTIDRWEFDEHGDVVGLWQFDPFIFTPSVAGQSLGGPLPKKTTTSHGISTFVFIPMQKILLFKTTSKKGNPEGRSILRNSFTSYFHKKRIQESESIGIERDLVGMPIFYLPSEMFDPDAGDDLVAQLAKFQDVIENIKQDEQGGLLIPGDRDEQGHRKVEFELASTGSRRLVDTDKVIKRYDVAIARTVLADFLMLGHQGTGSYALSDDKTELFSTALGAWLKSIAATLNRHGLTRLYELNGWNPSEIAQFVPGDIEKEDVERFANAIAVFTSAGFLTPGSEEDENHIRGLVNMPERVDSEADPATKPTDTDQDEE